MNRAQRARREIAACITAVIDGLSDARKGVCWGECTMEALPLARQHHSAEVALRGDAADRVSRASRLGLARRRRELPAAEQEWEREVDRLMEAVEGWNVDLSGIEAARDRMRAAVAVLLSCSGGESK